MPITLSAPIDSSGNAFRRTNGGGLDAPNPLSGGLVAATPNPSMTFANEVYRRSGGTMGVAPTAAQLANQAACGPQLTDCEWNSVQAGKYASSAADEMLWYQTGGRLGLPGNPNSSQTDASTATGQTVPVPSAGPVPAQATTAAADKSATTHAPAAKKAAAAPDASALASAAAPASPSKNALWFAKLIAATRA